MEEIIRDSELLTENYIQEDLKEFISVEKYRLLELEKMSIFVCSENQLHNGIREENDGVYCAECGAKANIIKRVK